VRDRLIDGLIQGDRLAWGAVGVLWVLTTLVVLAHRPGDGQEGGRSHAFTWLLFAVATATSLVGLPLSSALSVPRLRWALASDGGLPAPDPASWRRLRGPAVLVAGPDVAVPTVESGRWVLAGLLSGKPVEGLPAAEPAPMQPGAPRLCFPTGGSCRPWPVAWPDPTRPLPLGELVWSRPGAPRDPARLEGARAYDVETGLYLVRADPAPGSSPADPVLEVAGLLGGDSPRDPGVVFVIRRVAAGRIKAVRLVHLASHAGEAPAFAFHRAEVSLTAAPRAYAWFVRPILTLTALSLPLGVVALLLAPALYRARWRRAKRRGPPPYRQPEPGEAPARGEAVAWVAPYLEAAAVLSAGLAAAAPAVVAMAALWGSR
jgi:hypothetical protein